MTLLSRLAIFSGLAFLIYGILCLSTDSMKAEFERFGLENFRMMTGFLEVLGGIGLLVGLWWRPAMLLASAGLTALMTLGVGVRLRLKDSALETAPAFFLMLINFYIFLISWSSSSVV